MPSASPAFPPTPRTYAVWVAVAVIVVAAVLAYSRTFSVPLLLDDVSAITDNPSVRDLGDWRAVLHPPLDATTAGRPLLNLSFALNWAWGGNRVAGYHVVNLAIHVVSALLLFGIARRFVAPGARDATTVMLGAAVALLWALHPVVTEAVTYVSQRAESLMGCCYLATVYGFVRATRSQRPGGWYALAIGACAAGMAIKEVMVTAPLLMLLLDRVAVAHSWREAWRRRRGLYVGLAATWVLLAVLAGASHLDTWTPEGGRPVSPAWYALNETSVIFDYVRLCLWPASLVFDYGPGRYALSVSALLPALMAAAVAFGAMVWLWRRSPRAAFPAVAFLLLLAPTSSIVPIAIQPMAESRLYLPLAVVIFGVVAGLWHGLGRRTLVPLAVAMLALGTATLARNAVYRSDVALWSDSLAKFPANDRARNNLGLALAALPGREADARAEYEAALRLNPLNPEAHYNFANLLAKDPATAAAAEREYRETLRVRPGYARAANNLGLLLAELPGRHPDAVAALEQAVRLAPGDPTFASNLASALLVEPGREAEALARYRAALALAPRDAVLRFNAATALLRVGGHDAEAIAEYRVAIALAPGYVEAHFNLAAALLRAGQRAEAIAELETAARLRPDDARLRQTLDAVKSGMVR